MAIKQIYTAKSEQPRTGVHFIACIFSFSHFSFIFVVSETPTYQYAPRRGKVMKFWSYWKSTGGLKDPTQNTKDIKQPNNASENSKTCT